jgi:hypothetical protein
MKNRVSFPLINSHGVMPNLRQVASEGKRSPSGKSALHKGFSYSV